MNNEDEMEILTRYAKRAEECVAAEREEAARKEFGEILRKGFQPSELYMINIIQQEIVGDDPRLSTVLS